MTKLESLIAWLEQCTPMQAFAPQGIGTVPMHAKSGVAIEPRGITKVQTDICGNRTITQKYILWLRYATFSDNDNLAVHNFYEALDAICHTANEQGTLPAIASGYAQELTCGVPLCSAPDDSGFATWQMELLFTYMER